MSRWSPSAATAAASWRRTPTSTSSWCTTTGVDPGAVAEKVWYPLWDSGSRLDHSVRSLPQMVAAAEDDLKVALGLLDVRHLAGDPNLTLRLRTDDARPWRARPGRGCPRCARWSTRGTR